MPQCAYKNINLIRKVPQLGDCHPYIHCVRTRGVLKTSVGDPTATLAAWANTQKWPILEGSLLLGRDVVVDDASGRTPLRRGRWCPPLFSFHIDDDEPSAWRGLGLLRILQYIKHSGSATESACALALSRLGYPARESRWFFNRALMYGVIEVDELALDAKRIPFRLTTKGVFFCRSIFRNASLIYYQGAAVAFPPELHAPHNSVVLHQSDLGDKRIFSQSAISVGLAVFRCMHEAHSREMSILALHKDKASFDKLQNCFALPRYRECRLSWDSMYRGLKGRKSSGLSDTDPIKFWQSTILADIHRKCGAGVS